MTNNEIKNHLTFFKKNFVDLRNQDLYSKINEYFDQNIFLKNIEFLENNSLIIEDEQRNCTYSITEKGEKYLKQLIEEEEYLAEKERIEFEKSKTDLILAQKMLKEYPYTKWFARISIVIALGLGFLELIRYIKGQ